MVKFMFIDNDFMASDWLSAVQPAIGDWAARQSKPGLKILVYLNKGWSFVLEVIWLRLFH